MKIHLVASDEEQFYSQKTQMNIALKYSVVEDFISVIIFKSILKVKKERKFELQYFVSFSFQGQMGWRAWGGKIGWSSLLQLDSS